MGYITQTEFDKICEELLEREISCYDMLLFVTEKTVKNAVYSWCSNDPTMRGRGYEEDIMQEIRAQVALKTISDFLLKENNYNNSPSGFHGWLMQLARNKWCDFAKKIWKYQLFDTEINEGVELIEESGLIISSKDVDRLNKSVDIVLGSMSRPHIILTWFAQFVVIANYNVNRTESNIYIATLEERTLDEILCIILNESKKIIWFQPNEQHVQKLKEKLDIIEEDGHRRGDRKYKEFYMKKGPIESISDWINRMNDKVLKELPV